MPAGLFYVYVRGARSLACKTDRRILTAPLCCTQPGTLPVLICNSAGLPASWPSLAASGETIYPGFNTSGTDFGNPSTSPLQPTVLTLSLGTEQPANPMPPIVEATSPPYGSTFWA